ncbi:fumarylacetoacetate hydrolase family protein [Agrobacterium rhizogenes]|uniref:Fumarylacetoacetate hydrolase family protein n=1 Tax=Agrobacterium tumefaciens TaxID=358 RepID=A0A4D7YQ92_AGRTU|nr:MULTISPECIES: fumarylacetoacetate hydrolase family protein [Rhizobium/Agrobacterium group]NTG90775.1 fumarylacetoacetate hydrolase family protein [Rhizobium rhizogenes]NTI20048.1 fumarylacetoacetate hydrolase family protein [Rhizobium rhizogenes]NTI39438.1 fumarylacetoacetate hydrolase family protein [Rhizobium rhizogenes]NTJ65940.1 fumarylacetoacetate hydrolase family protein [Rhizobium rhizogenes]NTJ79437.1 fumarylacetoacetate hydrolase family protein [Rhizobium rhizogenes]
MKLVRFGHPGAEKPGLLDREGRIRDLSMHIADIDGASIGPETLRAIGELDPQALPIVENTVRLGSCITRVGNFIAVGLNYADHAAESGMPIPEEPILFNKAPSCIVGPNDTVLIPPGSEKTDWEVELAIVIGKTASYVSEDAALEHVAGYCICNDVSERSYQLERGGTWTKGKGCPTFGPLGPWLVTTDEVDVDNLSMSLKVNGELVQNGSTKTMIFRVPFIVSYISQFMRLLPGDVITTGTPPGVGMGFKPPRYLKAGDTMEVSIGGLGVQRQSVAAA